VQLAGTTLHELGHCLAGRDAGHGPEWKLACQELGLIRCFARSQAYEKRDYAPELWKQINALGRPTDGVPAKRHVSTTGTPVPLVALAPKAPPCKAGIGSEGGHSRGPGSGSRLRLYMCQCEKPPNKARVGSDEFKAQCLRCGSIFERVVATERRARKIRILRFLETPNGASMTKMPRADFGVFNGRDNQ
jgi:hypothetical protein